MGTTGRTFPIGFTALLVLLLHFGPCNSRKEKNHHCPPSFCGNNNISYPFRLRDDPEYCGERRYTLSCDHQNNLTVLYLYSGKFYVQAINYNNLTIRLVDAAIHEQKDHHNLSSINIIPRYPLSRFNVSLFDADLLDSFQWKWKNDAHHSCAYDNIELTEIVILLNCPSPVRSSRYLDLVPCVINGVNSDNSGSSSHYYFVVGDVSVSDLKDTCRVEMVNMISRGGEDRKKYTSCIDINKQIVRDFELSWYPPHENYCGLNSSGENECRRSCNKLLRSALLLLLALLHAAKVILGTPCVIAFLIYKWRRRNLSMYEGIEEYLQTHNNLMPIRYSYSDIKKITQNFKEKIGEGGYGTVFKGKLRSGSLVAIKMLGKPKADGQEFISEVATIGRIHHVNVVRLVGFCVEGSKRALVFDFMPNGSLDKCIFSNEGSDKFLSCEKTFEISLGIARGIEYLHRGCDVRILHFDIKPHNILLDENFTPKVSDFGLARLYPTDDQSIVSLTAARGTLGYIAPELFYKNIGGISYKADVYSFGMLLMELATRRKNWSEDEEFSSQNFFPSWVYDQFRKGKEIDIGDVEEEESRKLTKKMIMVALWCIQMNPRGRPSMNEVVDMLEGDLESLQMPGKPFLFSEELPVDGGRDNTDPMSSSTLSGDSSESVSTIPNASN